MDVRWSSLRERRRGRKGGSDSMSSMSARSGTSIESFSRVSSDNEDAARALFNCLGPHSLSRGKAILSSSMDCGSRRCNAPISTGPTAASLQRVAPFRRGRIDVSPKAEDSWHQKLPFTSSPSRFKYLEGPNGSMTISRTNAAYS